MYTNYTIITTEIGKLKTRHRIYLTSIYMFDANIMYAMQFHLFDFGANMLSGPMLFYFEKKPHNKR